MGLEISQMTVTVSFLIFLPMNLHFFDKNAKVWHLQCLFLECFYLAGIAYHSLKVIGPAKPSATAHASPVEEESWTCLQNRLLVPLAAQLMQHVARVLCLCAHVIEGTQPGPPKSQVKGN